MLSACMVNIHTRNGELFAISGQGLRVLDIGLTRVTNAHSYKGTLHLRTLFFVELIFLKYFVTIAEVGSRFGVGSTYSMSPVCFVLSKVILTSFNSALRTGE